MRPRYRLEKQIFFEAAHRLPHHDGKCRRLHGHSWKGKLILEGDRLDERGPKQGMLLDFGEVSSAVKPLVENYLDHQYLNDTTGLESPTSELLAKWIYDKMRPLLPLLVAVEIYETCTSGCEYRP